MGISTPTRPKEEGRTITAVDPMQRAEVDIIDARDMTANLLKELEALRYYGVTATQMHEAPEFEVLTVTMARLALERMGWIREKLEAVVEAFS